MYENKKQAYIPKKQELWWDNHCEQVKKEKIKALRFFRQNNTIENLTKYKEIRNKFKENCKQKNFDNRRKTREELIDPRKNSNLFWKIFKNSDIRRPGKFNKTKPMG